MKKAIDSYLAQYLKGLVSNEIVDMFMENNWLAVILENGMKVRIKQQFKGYGRY